MRALLRTAAARDGAWVIGAQGLSALVALVVDAYLFHALPKAQQGMLATGLTFSALLLQASDLGLALTTIRLGAKYFADGRPDLAAAIFRKTLRYRVCFSFALLGLTCLFAGTLERALNLESGRAVAQAAAAAVIGNAVVWWGVDVSQARRAFRAYALQQVAAALLKAAAIGALFFLYGGIVGASSPDAPFKILLSIAVANLLSGLLSLKIEGPSARLFGADGMASKVASTPDIFQFGAFACAISLLVALSSNADVLLVQHYLGEEDTAVFACARRLAMALNLLATACITVLLPRAAALNSRAECAAYLRKGLKAGILLGVVTAGGLALAAEILVPLFGGAKYMASIPILRWLCIAHGVGIASTPLLLVFYPLRREAALVFIYAAGLLALAALGVFWTPVYKLDGAAWAVIAGKFIPALLAAAFLLREFGREVTPAT